MFQFEPLKELFAAEYTDTNQNCAKSIILCVQKLAKNVNFYAIKFLSQGYFPTGKKR